MASITTLCFGDADGVTGDPNVNGLVDYDFLPFLPADPNEPGYTNGCRLTFSGGSLASVIFQGVRATGTDELVMGFMARFDSSFDEGDTIILALRSNYAADSPTRAIVIHPNIDGIGVEAGTGDGPNHIKRNVTPVGAQEDYYEFSGGTWNQISKPAGLKVRLRSWQTTRPNGTPDECCWSVEVSMPRIAGADWITLDDSFGLYFDVIRLINNMAAHSAFPTETPAPNGEPGVPGFAIPAWGRGLIPAAQMPPGSNTGLGVRFKNGWQGVGRRDLGSGSTALTGLINGKLGPPGLTDNEIVALLENTSPNAAVDVRAEFRFRNFGLGPPNFEAWSQPPGLAPNPTPRRVGITPPPLDPQIDLGPAPQPNMPTSAVLFSPWKRVDVPLQYNDHPHQCIWVQLEAAGGAAFTQAGVRRNMDFTHFSEVEREVEISGEGYPEPADGSGEHDFVIQTFCRQINLFELVGAKEVPPELKGIVEGTLEHAGDEAGVVGGVGFNDNATAVGVPPRDKWRNSVVYFWVAQGYRRTGTFIELRGKLYENLDVGPGECGVSAYHVGLQDPFHYSFSGPGLVQYAPGVYGVKVPHKGTTTVKVKLGATEGVKPGDHSELPREPLPRPKTATESDGGGHGIPGDLPKGCLAMLMGLFGKKS